MKSIAVNAVDLFSIFYRTEKMIFFAIKNIIIVEQIVKNHLSFFVPLSFHFHPKKVLDK